MVGIQAPGKVVGDSWGATSGWPPRPLVQPKSSESELGKIQAKKGQ